MYLILQPGKMKNFFFNSPVKVFYSLICFFIIVTPPAYSQFHSPENRRLFADHLFCTGDYLRAVNEYRSYLNSYSNDTILFKVIFSLSEMKKFQEAEEIINSLRADYQFYKAAIQLKLKNIFVQSDYYSLRKEYTYLSDKHEENLKLRNFTYLYTETDSLPSTPYVDLPFNGEEKKEIRSFYEMKVNLPRKNPWTAALLSAIIPGAGKIYTEQYGDALFSALATGISAYLAYTNFKAGHKFRGVLFTGTAAWFYGGNIYGSAASAILYNAKVNFSFTSLLDEYIKKKNYYLPDYGFCK
jgi:hypothetical protein